MADELNVVFKFKYSPSALGISGISLEEEDTLIDINGAIYDSGVQLIQTGEEQIEPDNDLSAIGFCYFKNVGQNNVILGRLGEQTIVLKPSEFCWFRANGPIYARTISGTTYVEYVLFED